MVNTNSLESKSKKIGSIRNKLLVWFLLLSLIPLTGLGVGTFITVRRDFQQNAHDKLDALQTIKAKQIEDYFEERQKDMGILIETLKFTRQEAFLKLESRQTVKKGQIEHYLAEQLTNVTLLASNPILYQALSDIDKESKAWLAQYKDGYHYDDLFLIDANGQILYTTAQNVGIDLNADTLKDSPLARAFQSGLRELTFQDFEIYTPLSDAPIALITAPVKIDGQTKGVVMVQLSPDRINAIMQQQTGREKSSTSYLVGADKYFRSDDPRHQDKDILVNPNYIAMSRAVSKSLAGETGRGFILNYRGESVLSTWTPLSLPGLQWVIVSEVGIEEALTPDFENETEDFLTQHKNIFGYDDLFLINPKGHFIYVVEYQPIYQANLLTGLYKNSNLGRLVTEVLKDETVYELTDFEKFAPNNDAPSAFIASPILYEGEVELVAVLQLSLDKINAIMQERTGFGETGETYLVGQDKLWRSDSHYSAELGVDSTILNPDMIVDTAASQSALAGKTDTQVIKDYRGVSVLSSWSTIVIDESDKDHPDGIKWAVIAEIDETEVNQPVVMMAMIAGGLGIASIIMVFVVTLWVSNNLTAPIKSVANVATNMAEGDLTKRAEVSTGDEIEQMAVAFNSMADELVVLVGTLEQRVADRTQRLEVVATLGEQLNAILDIEQLLTELVNQIKANFDYYHVHIYILTKNNDLVMSAGVGEAGEKMKAAGHRIPLNAPTSLVAQAARSSEVVRVDNVREAEDWLSNPLLPDTYSEMAVPIIREGQVVGVLDVQSDKMAGLDEGDANLLRSLAGHVAVAMTNARLFAQNQTSLQETETLYTISQRMITATDMSELIAAVVEEANLPVINRAVLGMFEYDSVDNLVGMTVEANWYSGHGVEPTSSGTHYTAQMLDVLALFLSAEPLFFEDTWQDERVGPGTMVIVKRLSIRTVIVLPLHGQQHQLGVLLLEGEEPYQFSKREVRPYLSMLGQLATAVENRQLLAQTIQAKEKAELANQAKSEFLSNMSHELRTPLNGILGYAQILKRKPNLETNMLDGLNIIQRSGNHLLTLIEDILDLSKIEARKMDIYPTEVDLPNFLEGLVGIMRMKANEKDVLFKHETNNLPKGVVADEKRLRQVLLNLLGNAIKFTDEGSVMLNVSECANKRIANSDDANELLEDSPIRQFANALIRFEIIDTGAGMTSEQTSKIFEAFEQVGDVKKRSEGTGLGLAITKQLVELMGGDLQVQSKLGEGSTFWFEISLPVVVMADDKQNYEADHQIIGYDGEQRKVLIVDDIASNRAVLFGLLEPLGFVLKTATDGLEGVKIASQWQPDLILTDLVMPNMNGLELIQKVRATPLLLEIKTLILSASSFDRPQWDEAIQLSDGFLDKPFKVNDLFDLMADSLGLTWQYEEQVDSAPADKAPAELIVPHKDELTELYRLAKRGSMRKVRRWAKHIIEMDEQYRLFAEQVEALAKQYDGQAIEELAEQYL